jgi:nucleoside-diphosphate-sugar epimerase
MSTINTAFVTGATGYVGHAVARAFRAAGWSVRGLVRDWRKAAMLTSEEIAPVAGLLERPQAWREAAASADVLVHAAAIGGPEAMSFDAASVRSLIDIASRRQATLIYTSGVWVHGDTHGAVVDESAALAPPALVARRAATERLVLDAGPIRGMVIRPAIVFGRRGGLTASFFRDDPIVGDGANHWPLVHVDDLADAYVRAAEFGRTGAAYIVADGSTAPVRDLVLAARVAQARPGAPRWMTLNEARAAMGPFADALALDQKVSAARAQRELGWRPRRAGFIAEAGLYAAANQDPDERAARAS